MTGLTCYQAALALLAETTDTAGYYTQFALPCLNQVLADCLHEINATRACAGLPPLDQPPQLQDLSGEIPVDEAMAAACLPYGLAALLVCEDDKAKYNWCAAAFAERLARYSPVTFAQMEEMY